MSLDVGELFVRHHAALRSYVFSRMLGAAEPDAEDVYATVWERATRAAGTYQDIQRSKNWLYMIATNLIRDYYGSSAWKLRAGAVPAYALLDEYHPVIVDRYPSDTAHVREAVERLGPDQRDVVLLRYWHDLSFPEASTALGVSEVGCKKRVSRAWKNLRRDLERVA